MKYSYGIAKSGNSYTWRAYGGICMAVILALCGYLYFSEPPRTMESETGIAEADFERVFVPLETESDVVNALEVLYKNVYQRRLSVEEYQSKSVIYVEVLPLYYEIEESILRTLLDHKRSQFYVNSQD